MQEINKICNIFFQRGFGLIIGAIIFSLVLVGCDSDSDHMTDGDTETAQTLHTGIFVDSPVKGLYYYTETQSGVTDEEGTFTYLDGEKVAFHLGDLELGETTAAPVLTPIDLVEGAEDETDQTVTNICRLLQTLDADENPENGIAITQETSDAIMTDSVDFMMDEVDFENQDDMIEIMDNLMDVSGFEHGRMMVSGEQAQMHMRGNMMDLGMMNGEMGTGGSMMDDGGMMSDDHMGNGGSMMDDDTTMTEDMDSGETMMDDDDDTATDEEDDDDHMTSEDNMNNNGGSHMGGRM